MEMRVASTESSFFHEAVVILLQEGSLHLSHHVQQHTDKNEQGGAAEELSDDVGQGAEDGEQAGQEVDERQEERAGEGEARHRLVQESSGRRTGTDAGDVAAGALEVLRDLLGLEHRSHPEEREEEDHEGGNEVVPNIRGGEDGGYDAADKGIAREELLGEHAREREDRRSENDRHHARVVELEREVGRAALSHLTVSHDAFGGLHGDAALGLADRNHEGYHDDHEEDQRHERKRAQGVDLCAIAHDKGFPSEGEGARQRGDDVHRDDERDAVAYAALGDLVADPHEEHGAGDDDEDGGDGENPAGIHHEIVDVQADGRGVFQGAGEQEALHNGNDDGEDARVARHLLPPAFLSQHLLPGGEHGAHELGHNGGGDVGHDTQSEDAALLQAATGENREDGAECAEDAAAFRGLFLEVGGKGMHIHPGKRKMNPETHHHDHGEGEEDAAPEFRNLHGVGKGGYH